MQLAFFTSPALDPGQSSAALDTFLASHRVLAIDRRFVDDGAGSYWAICVTYQRPQAAHAASTSTAAARRSSVDYRELLSERDFAVFAKLRTLRKEIAAREKKPAYAVFNNEQLATMVRNRIVDKTDLAAVDGVGQSRVTKYGKPFLALLRAQLTDAPTPDQTVVPSLPHTSGQGESAGRWCASTATGSNAHRRPQLCGGHG